MTTTITDAFDLPRPEDIRAMGFVVKLRESDPGSDEVKQLVDDYVITPAVEKELPRILDDMKQVFDRGEEYGRFIHGSFGSGKSHFMTMLSLLLEGTPPAWNKFRPLVRAHKDSQASKGRDSADHEAWLAQAGLLVVRIHMLSVRGKSTGFDRAVYEGFNAALKRRSKAPFEFLNVDAILEEVRREAKEYGDVVWKRLEAENIVGGREDFEGIASGSTQARERFARTWLTYKGRDAADAGIDPRWSDGLSRMAEHAKAQGFGGIVLMIDEFLLWLAEKSGQEFVQEINNLNVIVDHNTGQRPAPIFVFVARQRNLQEFFPDLVDESKIHEHLDHHAKRFGEVLGRARSKVDNPAQRFKVFWGALKRGFGLEGVKGFEDGGANEGDWDLGWRRTRRRGRIKLGNVREMSYDDFTPPAGAFKVLVDYPWDEPGHTVDEDRLRAINVRKKQGLLHTVCWLPRHMSPTELGVLTELAAVRYLLSDAGQEDLLETLNTQDRNKILDQASIRLKTLDGQLEDLLKEVYVHHGEFFALISDVDSSRPRETLAQNLEHIAALLMDRRYPQHPTFLADPKKQDLEVLLDWMVQAGETNVSVAYDESVGRVLKTIGQPLELVDLGQTKASLRLDSRYIKDVLQRTDQDSVSWTPIADHLRETYGFQPLIVDLFLCFLCQRDHRALQEIDGETIDVRIGMPQTTRVRLQRGKLVSAADWHRLRDLGNQLFEEPRPPAHRSLQGQDRFAVALRGRGQAKRTVIQGLHSRLVHLGVEQGDRLTELSTVNTRLGAVAQTTTDSYKVLAELLAAWPDDNSDVMRSIVQQADTIRDALGELDEHARANLNAGVQHAAIGVEVRGHLSALEGRLTAAQAEQPLTKDWISTWNKRAQDLIKRLIEQPQPQTPTPPQPPQPPIVAPPSSSRVVLLKVRVDPNDADAISSFLAQARRALSEQSGKSINVVLTREEDAE